MKKSILFSITLLAMLMLTACDNDDFATGAEPPIFDKLTLSQTKASPGEEITGFVTYKYEGKDVIKMNYNVRAVATPNVFDLTSGELTGENLKNISFNFKAPDLLGDYRIVFSVSRVSVSTGNAQGGPYVSNPSSVYAILKVE